jgi:predicted MPP superfamily phosphohydrolase
MKFFQIASDVHLEFYGKKRPHIVKHGDFLALLGDIGKPFVPSYKEFLQEQANQFEKVFVIMGNHEYYNARKTQDKILEQARKICSEIENVHLLERDAFQLTDEYVLLGCTLWSPIEPNVVPFMNDFIKINVTNENGVKRKLLRDDYIRWHHRDLFWLEENIQRIRDENEKAGNGKKRIIVLTHHAPLKVMSGVYQGSPQSSAFVSQLAYLFKPPVVAFANGHVHSNCDFTFNGIRCVSNAMGYPGEGVNYKEDVCITLD